MHPILDFILIIVIAIIAFVSYVIITKKTNLIMPICKIPVIGNIICTCPAGYSRTIYDWGTSDPPCNNGCAGRYKAGDIVNGQKLGSDGMLDTVWGKYPNQCWAGPDGSPCRVGAVAIDQPGSFGVCGGVFDQKKNAIKLGAVEVTYNPYLAK
jgi:hypothetical protein